MRTDGKNGRDLGELSECVFLRNTSQNALSPPFRGENVEYGQWGVRRPPRPLKEDRGELVFSP